MSDFFILSSAFITNTFLYMLDYVLDCKISQVKLLNENHSIDELRNTLECEFVLCNDIADGFNSNIFILENNKIPISSIEKITQRVKPTQVFKFQSPWGNQINLKDIPQVENIQYRQIPTILNISIGEISQQYCTEVLLNKIFSDKKINFVQEYSSKTRFMFNQMMIKGILNSKLATHINNINKIKPTLVIKSIEFSNINDFTENMQKLNKYSPDFIVLNVDRRFDKLEDIREILLYKFGCETFIIHSNYIEVERTSTDRIYAFISPQCGFENINLINHINLKSKLEDSIFSKIGYPQKICVIC